MSELNTQNKILESSTSNDSVDSQIIESTHQLSHTERSEVSQNRDFSLNAQNDKTHTQSQESHALKQNAKGDYLLKDENGKNHILKKETADKWLETFNLKNLSQDFKPQFNENIKQILNAQGISEIHLKTGALLKVAQREREEFIAHIKPTLENPHFVFKDSDGIIFARDIGKDKVIFTSIAKDINGEWIIATNSFKRVRQLENKLRENNLQGLYKSKEAPDILVGAFTDKPFPAKLDESIAKQPTQSQTATQQATKESTQSAADNAYEIGKKRAQNFKPNKHEPLQTQLDRLQEQTLKINKELADIDREIDARKVVPNSAARIQELKARRAEIDIADYWESYHKEKIIKKILDDIKQIRDFSPKDIHGDALISTDVQAIKEQIKETKKTAKKWGQKIEASDKEMLEKGKNALKERREKIEQDLDIKPLQEYGTNYAEFYHDGQNAIKKLIAESQYYAEREAAGELTQEELAQGYKAQVAGAFHRNELGDIDLVWGDDTFGLKHILQKHEKDFTNFKGDNLSEQVANAISEIVEKGKLVEKNGVFTLWHKKGENWYLAGLSKGYNGEGDNLWIITSYKKTKGQIPNEL